MLTRPALLLRLEGIALFVASTLVYRHIHGRWILYAVLFLAPDLFMLGYLLNVKIGAAVYNLIHTLFVPAVLLAVIFLTGRSQWVPYLMIWIAHIGFDRVQGYGLKYPTFFTDTHLQHV